MTRIGVDKSTDHVKPHFDLFLPQYQRQRKRFFLSEHELKRNQMFVLLQTFTAFETSEHLQGNSQK